jgi:uncharacterized membrane protein
VTADFYLRREVWHPLSVHFPIALLISATVISIVTSFLTPERKHIWQKVCVVILLAGSIGAWISIYTGSLADGIVARKLCDPTVLKKHEIAAFTLAYLFSAATLIHLFMLFAEVKYKIRNILYLLSVILMIVGSGYLIYTGHLGASLVYEQGAGVNKPSADCAGFK